MAITKAKAKLVDMKIKKYIKNPCVEKYKIVLVVNQAWTTSFARVEYNKKAIAAGGWNPLTFNLLDNPEIHGTMTEEDCNERNNKQLMIMWTHPATILCFLPYKRLDS